MAAEWIDVAEDAWYRRYEPWDVNVGVVRGADGLCVIDTRGSHRQARQLIEDLRVLGGPVRAVVNTHWHFDHTWGNTMLKDAGAGVWGHVSLPATMSRWFDDVRDSLSIADPAIDDELAEITLTPPDHLVDPIETVDLGDRTVDVRFLGVGHTDGDVVAAPSSSAMIFAGDLVEQAGPPAYGDDSHPLEWPDTAARLVELLDDRTTIVPGHGTAVDRAFCQRQQGDLAEVAALFRELHAAAVPAKDALREGRGRWPLPEDRLGEALFRAYADLSRP